MKSLLRLEWIQTWRNWPMFILAVGMPVAIFLFFSATVVLENAEMTKQFIQGYMLTMTAFSMSSFALFTFPIMLKEDQTNHYLTYIEHSPIRIGHYYLAKVMRVLLYFFVSIMATFFAGAFLRGVTLTWDRWLLCILFLIITNLVFLAIGLLLAQILNQQMMSLVANIVFMGLAIVGGSWWPISMFPEWMQQLSKLTPTYHVNQVVTDIAVKGNFSEQSLLIVLGYAIIITVLAIRIKHKGEVK